MDLLFKITDFLLTEEGLNKARANLSPKLVNSIYMRDPDLSDDEEKRHQYFMSNLDCFTGSFQQAIAP